MRFDDKSGKDTVYVNTNPNPNSVLDTVKKIDTAKLLTTARLQIIPATPNIADTLSTTTTTATTIQTIVKKDTVVVAKNTLFVIIDGLNVRTEPNLKAKSLGKLKLFDQVIFMNEVTDTIQKISLGYEEATEPWVKIKTKKGTIGWVYGAGVSYYKKKRKGVIN
ncbi:MAG: SH3 domain-containing protein [Saprospiraceae bacterium]|nr:SH3 domain-containing protein [Saprospiraceae bacterium]